MALRHQHVGTELLVSIADQQVGGHFWSEANEDDGGEAGALVPL
jgi:hypothetical protein